MSDQRRQWEIEADGHKPPAVLAGKSDTPDDKKWTNSDIIVIAYEKAHPPDNSSSENVDLIDGLIVRIQRMEGRVLRWESTS